jgi:predicted phage terminase large subunit-like protein
MISDLTKREVVGRVARQELARRGLLDFAQMISPAFVRARHLVLLADLLERVERDELRRLIVTIHPGSGKSTLLQLFCAWYLGRNPKHTVIGVSAGSELAERNSRATRACFSEDKWPFSTRLSADTTAQHRWNTTDKGGFFACGTGGLITGWRSQLIIADDCQNSYGTATERASLITWWREVLTPRLEPGGAIVLVQARMGPEDLPGQLIDAPDGDLWDVVRLPAFAEAGDPLNRSLGEPLWPERFDVAELEQRRTAMGSRAFETQYQGNPIPQDSGLIKLSWFMRYTELPRKVEPKPIDPNADTEIPEELVSRDPDYIVQALDAASKTGVSNDYSALVTVRVTKDAIYVIDVDRRRVEFPDLLRMVEDGYEKHLPRSVYVEDTSNAVALIQTLQVESRLPIIPIKATASKISRVEGITGILEAGNVFLPEEAPWLVEFEREVSSFPSGKTDDMLDAFTMAVTEVSRRSRSLDFSFMF